MYKRRMFDEKNVTGIFFRNCLATFLPLPGIVWLESCGPRSSGGIEVQTATVEVDRISEA